MTLFWKQLKMRKLKTADSGLFTMCYRTTWPAHYKRYKKPALPDAKSERYQAEQSRRITALRRYFLRLQTAPLQSASSTRANE